MDAPHDRRDDWRHGVDENLASLNAGQRVWERELTTIRNLLSDIDKLLRGDPKKDTDGLVSRLHHQENEVNLLKAILLKDASGSKGLVGRVEVLESGERRSEGHLKLWIAIVGLLSALLVAAVSNIDRIETFLNKKPKDPLERMIDSAKHPRPRYHHYVIHENPEEPE